MQNIHNRCRSVLTQIHASLQLFHATDTTYLKNLPRDSEQAQEVNREIRRLKPVARLIVDVLDRPQVADQDILRACIAGLDAILERAAHYRQMAQFGNQIAYARLAIEVSNNAIAWRRYIEDNPHHDREPAGMKPAA